MNAAQTEQFRQNLLRLRTELREREASSREAGRTVELDQASVGRLSRMDAMQMQQMAHEEERRRQLQLAKVEGALKRIDSGDYGDCALCGEAIDVRRLSVDAAATRCVGCAEK